MTKIVLLSQDPVGKKMAGPGIRYFEMAKVFSKHHDTTLLIPNKSNIKISGIKIKQYSNTNIIDLVDDNSYIITQPQKFRFLKKLKNHNLKLVTDLYAPAFIEIKEHKRYSPIHIKMLHSIYQKYLFYLQIFYAKIILCANPRQKMLYEKMSKRLFLRKKIIEVPFGISNIEPKFIDRNRIYKKFPNIQKNDQIIIWGGGVWNWFDPMTTIKAIELLSKKRNDVKLVFLGVKPPNPKIKDFDILNSAVKYCKKNNLLNKYVFFNFGWTPYSERVDYLLASKIGISTHFDNLETKYSFRTRILDYLWTELPIVSSRGDYFASIVEKRDLGLVVNYESVDEIVRAILKILRKPDKYKQNISRIKKNFTWKHNLKELISTISSR